jgi:DNA-binding LacI/PurR family transcriptional regulator
MVTKWSVGYQTVKSALDLLERDGLIRCEPGRGKGPIVLKADSTNKKLSLAFVRLGNNPIFCEISDGIKSFASEKQLEFNIIDCGGNISDFLQIIASPRLSINGLILYPYETQECLEAITAALNRGVKIVCVDRDIKGIPTNSVAPDHFDGAYKATCHLLSTHKLPVHYVGHVKEPDSCRLRVSGWAAAMRNYGFDNLEAYTHAVPFSETDSMNATRKWLDTNIEEVCDTFIQKQSSQKYSILAMNDYVAKEIYLAAEQRSLKIGQDIFIVGFGNLPFCEKLDVPLSSIEQFSQKVGYEAANVLYHDFIMPQSAYVHHVIPVELQIRVSSTGL